MQKRLKSSYEKDSEKGHRLI